MTLTISELLVYFTTACLLLAAPFAWAAWCDLRDNPVSVDEVEA